MQKQPGRIQELRKSILDFWQKQDWKAVLVLVILTAAISGLIFYRRIAFPTNNDYSTHILYTQQIIDGNISDVPELNLAHPGLQFLLVGLHWLSLRGLGLYALLMLVLTGTQVLTALVLYFFWFAADAPQTRPWQRVFWAVTLTLVTPVMLLAPVDGQYYFGYIGLANYHNPTILMLRPLALLSFLFAVRILSPARSSVTAILSSAVLIVLSALIKPSYAVTLGMGLAGMTVLFLYQKKPLDWRMLILGFGVPASLTLAAQWVYLFLFSNSGGEGILLQPFAVERAFSEQLLLKFVLSILFPLSVILVYPRDALRKVDMQLAWLTFLAGALQMYLLAEGGDRFFHGNFRWGAQIALFLLFAVSARYLLRLQNSPALLRNRGNLIVNLVYLAHVLAGIAYYLHALFSIDYG